MMQGQGVNLLRHNRRQPDAGVNHPLAGNRRRDGEHELSAAALVFRLVRCVGDGGRTGHDQPLGLAFRFHLPSRT